MNLTYEKCKEIVSKNPNFYEKVDIVDGFKISTFNYILSIYDQFKKPHKDIEESAFELRGLSFVFDEQNNYKRYLMLHKFFNLNENKDYLLNDLKNHRIISVQEKLDGSMIRFLKLPNGKIVAKTKIGFSNSQADTANRLLKSDKVLSSFVSKTLDQDCAAIFELCSPFNKILLDYDIEELKLLQLRDEKNGVYLDIYNHPLVKEYNVKTTAKCDSWSFDQIVEKQKTDTNKEGWVLTLDNGVMVKAKTIWYFERHKLLDETSYENNLVKLIIEEKIDDAISLLDEKNERKKYIRELQLYLMNYLTAKIQKSMELLSKYNGNKKEFAIEHSKDENFHSIASFLGQKDCEEKVKDQIKKNIIFNTRKKEMAKTFLKNIGFKTTEWLSE